jgi:hypothetical protein
MRADGPGGVHNSADAAACARAGLLKVEERWSSVGESRNLAAIVTKSARDRASIFSITRPRVSPLTVISLIPSSKLTCLFNWPRTTHARASIGRIGRW